ncbi:MAG: helix-turn-helix domain-containing protein [Lachnospiraceae bacterium]|nr:helix-turn-helix domain-containing protein [Lachnospiraceae bacterium]
MKLIICDDDISTIDFIRANLDPDQFGITEVLFAYNGQAAKEQIKLNRPELILCDIGMPICDGIQVLKYVSELNYGAQFTFLSCHESFEYAREALRYGAREYLTKPVRLEELWGTLRRMVSAVQHQEGSIDSEETRMREEDLLINSFLQRLRDGIYGKDKEKIVTAIARRNLVWTADSVVRCVLVSADLTQAMNSVREQEQEQVIHQFQLLTQEMIARREDFRYSLVDLDARYITITALLPADEAAEQELIRRSDHLISVCRSQLSLRPVCLIGRLLPLYELPQENPELQRRLYKHRLQQGKVYLFRETDMETMDEVAPALDKEKIVDCIKRKDKAGYLGEVSAVANRISVVRKGSDYAMAMLHRALTDSFGAYLEDNGISEKTLLQEETLRLLDAKAEHSVYDMMRFAMYQFDYVTSHIQELSTAENLVGRAIRYIGIHYRENIDRNSVAAAVYVTPNYLSKRFSAEVGMNMREYINNLRVQEAKRLLLSTNLPVTKIANDVGFDNISYFSTVFRRLCGMAPIDWRNRKERSDSDEMDGTNTQG